VTALAERVQSSATSPADPVRRARHLPRRRHRAVAIGLALVLLLAFAARVLGGDFTITIGDFFRILSGTDIPGASYILMESKLPRAVLAVLVGAALGVGGAVFQTVLRNPLASPDIIGVSVGASTAAVVAIVVLGLGGWPVSAAAVVGAVGISALVRAVAGPATGYRLVLVGVGAAAALQSVIQYLFTRTDEYKAHLVLRWLTGSVSSAAWPSIGLLTLLLLLLTPVLIWLSGSLRVLELGKDTATGLGVPGRHAEALLLVAIVLTACAVAAAGPVAFVGFLSGPIARALNAGRTTLPGAGLTGAVLVVVADYLGDYLFTDINLPAGVVTGALGAPFLLWLLASGRTGRRAR
jgi:iron complex transport system permease protein